MPRTSHFKFAFLQSLTDCLFSPDLYCSLEVDSFGYFVNKAKTRVHRDSTEPNWNEARAQIRQVDWNYRSKNA